MKILKRIKRPVQVTSYVPPKVITLTTTQVQLLKRLNIPIDDYANQFKYKNRYGGMNVTKR